MVAAPATVSKPQARDLLTWYDRHRRALPWRARPGEVPDPYRVWLSEIMLQQTNVTAVRPYFASFLERFPTLERLASAPVEAVMQAWAGLGYYSRARNLHACAQVLAALHGGRFPETEAELRKLPGIGAYTAAAIAAIAFNRPAAAVDGNVERVVSRLFLVEEPLPAAKAAIKALTESLVPTDRPGDFAQALMDLGATLCTPRRPACALCPWTAPCGARAAGLQESFPRKPAKTEGALRRGAAFVAIRADAAILLRTRPAKGLLGGMTEPPTSAWAADYDPRRRGRRRARPRGVAAARRNRPAHLHAFPARADGVRRRRRDGNGRARRHALDAARRPRRGGAAERHEEGAGSRARQTRVILGRSEAETRGPQDV